MEIKDKKKVNVNKPGTVVHGTFIENLENILAKGLDQSGESAKSGFFGTRQNDRYYDPSGAHMCFSRMGIIPISNFFGTSEENIGNFTNIKGVKGHPLDWEYGLYLIMDSEKKAGEVIEYSGKYEDVSLIALCTELYRNIPWEIIDKGEEEHDKAIQQYLNNRKGNPIESDSEIPFLSIPGDEQLNNALKYKTRKGGLFPWLPKEIIKSIVIVNPAEIPIEDIEKIKKEKLEKLTKYFSEKEFDKHREGLIESNFKGEMSKPEIKRLEDLTKNPHKRLRLSMISHPTFDEATDQVINIVKNSEYQVPVCDKYGNVLN